MKMLKSRIIGDVGSGILGMIVGLILATLVHNIVTYVF